MMNKKFSKTEIKGLPGGPNQQFTYVTGVFLQDMYHAPIAQKGLEKYQTKGEFIPNISSVPRSSTYVEPSITMSPEEFDIYNNKQKSNPYQYFKDFFNYVDKGIERVKKDPAIFKRKFEEFVDDAYLEEDEIPVVNKGETKLSDILKNGKTYEDLSESEFGLINNFVDPNKMDQEYKDFSASRIIGGDYYEKDASYITRPAEEYQNLDWKKEVEKTKNFRENATIATSYKDFQHNYPERVSAIKRDIEELNNYKITNNDRGVNRTYVKHPLNIKIDELNNQISETKQFKENLELQLESLEGIVEKNKYEKSRINELKYLITERDKSLVLLAAELETQRHTKSEKLKSLENDLKKNSFSSQAKRFKELFPEINTDKQNPYHLTQDGMLIFYDDKSEKGIPYMMEKPSLFGKESGYLSQEEYDNLMITKPGYLDAINTRSDRYLDAYYGVVPDFEKEGSFKIGDISATRTDFNPKTGMFYSVEDGKFKVGKASDFKKETLITPMRFGYKYYDKNNPPTIEKFDKYHSNSAHSGLMKSLLYSPKTGAVGLTNTREGIIDFYNKYGDVIPVYLDDGRFGRPHFAPEGEKLNYSDYQDYMAGWRSDRQKSGVYTGYQPRVTPTGVHATNIYTKQKGGEDLPKYQFKGSFPTTHMDSIAHQADKILQYEQLRGGPGGIPLPSYSDPKYMKMLMQDIYPEVSKILPNATATEKAEAMDFIFNAGWDKTNNKIKRDPRAYALQEYYRLYDKSKLDKNGNWSGRRGAPYSFDEEYKNTIGKLSENERRILMNKGRDWYYRNINVKSDGSPNDNYFDTWYGRIWNTNDFSKFNPKNPKFTPKRKSGGLQKYQGNGRSETYGFKENYDHPWQKAIFDNIGFGSNKVPDYMKNNVLPIGNNTYEATPYSLPVAEVWGNPINRGTQLAKYIAGATGYIAENIFQTMASPEALAAFMIDKSRGKDTEFMDVLPKVASDVVGRKSTVQPDVVTSLTSPEWVKNNPGTAAILPIFFPGFSGKKKAAKNLSEIEFNKFPDWVKEAGEDYGKISKQSDIDFDNIMNADNIEDLSKAVDKINMRLAKEKLEAVDRYNELVRNDEIIQKYGSIIFNADNSFIDSKKGKKILKIIDDRHEELRKLSGYNEKNISNVISDPKNPGWVHKPSIDDLNTSTGDKALSEAKGKFVEYFKNKNLLNQKKLAENVKKNQPAYDDIEQEVLDYIKNLKRKGGEGYREGAPNYNASSKLIPSSNITMTEKDGGPLKKGPLLGIDNMGNQQVMFPGYNYVFPGNMVMEIPLRKAQQGMQLPTKEQIANDPELMNWDNYNTPLTKKGEKEFKKWMKEANINPWDRGAYDIQGYWKEQVEGKGFDSVDDDGHRPDTFKKPNHPTFSMQSKYADYPGVEAGFWDGPDYYAPSTHRNLYGLDYYDWMNLREPDRQERFAGYMEKPIIVKPKQKEGLKKAQYLNSQVFEDLKKQSKKSTGVIEQAEEVTLPNRILNAMAQPMTYRANKNQGINSPYVIGLNPFDIALAYVNPTVAFKTGKKAIKETAKGNYGNALLNAAYTASYLPYLKALPLKQEGGTSWTDYLNPFNWGAKNMDDVGDFQTAFRTARGAGYDDFMWQGDRYSTELAEQPNYENLFYDKSLLDNLSDEQKQRREALLYNADLIAKSQGDNEDLRRLLIMTSAMENSLGANPKAYGRDYTRGPMSIDNIAWRDVFDVREGANNYTAQQKKNEKWLNSLGLDMNNLETLLRSDDPLASMAVARLVYGRIPESLPSGDDPKAMFDYYLNYYNRKGLLKHGTPEQHYARFLKDYNRIYKKSGGEFQRLVDKYTTKGWNSLTDTEKQEYKNYYNNM